MKGLLKSCVAVLLCASGVLFAGTATAFDDGQRTEIEGIVREYLLRKPEVLLEAMQILQRREETAQSEQRQNALVSGKDRIYSDPDTPVVGNPKGDVTVVEFFDYQCGYCKAVRESLVALMEKDDKVRVLMKEFPILGPVSTYAAKAALAARLQGKYWEYHNAVMATRSRLSEGAILDLARRVGLDTDRLKADMERPEIGAAIERNLELAALLSIQGTPAFIIGQQVVPGAADLDALTRLVAEERKGR